MSQASWKQGTHGLVTNGVCVCVVGEGSLRGCWEGRRSQETRDPEGESLQVSWHSECDGGLEYVLPKICPSPDPVPANVTLFRDRVLADVITLRLGQTGLGWALMQ